MPNWSPTDVTTLVSVVLGFVVVLVMIRTYSGSDEASSEASVSSEEGTPEQNARLLGEFLGQCANALKTETVDQVLAIFGRSSPDQQRTIVAALNGLLESAEDGPENLNDPDGLILAIARRLGDPDAAGPRPAQRPTPAREVDLQSITPSS